MTGIIAQLRKELLAYQREWQVYDIETLVHQALDTALTPVRILTSRAAVKAYLSAFLFFSASSLLISVSTTAYLFFYYNYIPQINLEKTVHLQYGPNMHPYAVVALDSSQIVSQQAYDIDVHLDMPRTPFNLAAGNFMLDLTLLTDTPTADPATGARTEQLSNNNELKGKHAAHHSSRPAILPYTSPITSLSNTLLHLPFHLLSLKNLDATVLTTPLFERLSFARGRASIPKYAYLEIQTQLPPQQSDSCLTPFLQNAALQGGQGLISSSVTQHFGNSLQIYSAKLVFHAHFQGLRYIIYNYRISAFVVFTAMFYMFSLVSMGLTWAGASNYMQATPQPSNVKQELRGPQQSDTVKHEPSSGEGQLRSLPAYSGQDTPLDSSDAEHEARMGGLIAGALDPGHEAEDEDEEDESEQVIVGETPVALKRESDNDEGREAVRDSGIGTSMESEQTGAESLVRRRSARGGGSGLAR